MFECSNKSRILVPSLGLFCFCLFVCFAHSNVIALINLIAIFLLYSLLSLSYLFCSNERQKGNRSGLEGRTEKD